MKRSYLGGGVAYFIRVLGRDTLCVPHGLVLDSIASTELPFEFRGEADGDTWDRLELCRRGGPPIVVIERQLVTDANRQSMIDLVRDMGLERPVAAVEWLTEYLPNVRIVYRFEVLPAINEFGGWAALHVVQGTIWEWAGGILQSDAEGFTNENGYYILWNFRQDAQGLGNLAVFDDGDWLEFQMDLANPDQQRAFLAGHLPDNAEEGALSSP